MPSARTTVAARNIKLLLIENAMLDVLPRSELRADGVHFTPAGYTILSERILPQLRTAVETRAGMVARRKQRNEWKCLVIPTILAFR